MEMTVEQKRALALAQARRKRAEAEDSNWRQSSIFPIRRNVETGNIDFDITAGIPGAIIDAVKLPRDVMEGRVDPMSPEGIGRVLETATIATPMPAAGRAVTSAARRAAPSLADEFGIPLTRGQASGDVAQQAVEQSMRNAGRGGAAQRVMQQFDDSQQAAVRAAGEGIRNRVGGQAIETPAVAGEMVTEGVRGRVADLKAAGRLFYKQAEDGDVRVAVDAVRSAPQRVRGVIDEKGVLLDDQLTPAATRALKEIDRLSELPAAVRDGEPLAMSLRGIEQTRKRINGLSGASPEDMRAMRAVKEGFDAWLDDAVDAGLFSGDPVALEALKKARRTWSEFKSITAPKTGDDAGRYVAKMADADVTPQEVANWLYGSSIVKPPGAATRTAKRVKSILGEDSPEWAAVREGAWLRLSQAAEGATQPGAQRVSQDILRFLGGEGGALANVLFTQEERALMRRYANAIRKTINDPKAGNPSRSGYRVQEGIQPIKDMIAGMLTGGATGVPAIGVGAAVAAPGVRNMMGARAARRAVTPAPVDQPIGAALGARAGLTGTAAQLRERRSPEITAR